MPHMITTGARMTRRAALAALALLGGTLAVTGLPFPAGRSRNADAKGMSGLAHRALRALHPREARAARGTVALPPPDISGATGGTGNKPLMQALAARASTRSFREDAIPDQVLGDLLWAAWGVNRPDGRRTVPTARNRQGMDVYVVRADGAWRYDGTTHALEPAADGDLRPCWPASRSWPRPRSPWSTRHPRRKTRCTRPCMRARCTRARGYTARPPGSATWCAPATTRRPCMPPCACPPTGASSSARPWAGPGTETARRRERRAAGENQKLFADS